MALVLLLLLVLVLMLPPLVPLPLAPLTPPCPRRPVPGVFRVDAWTQEVMQGGRRLHRQMEISDGQGTVFCTLRTLPTPPSTLPPPAPRPPAPGAAGLKPV